MTKVPCSFLKKVLPLATIVVNRESVYRATDSKSHALGGCLVLGGLGQLLYSCSISESLSES